MTKSKSFKVGHEALTRGGMTGHLLRRLLHICSAVIPIIYYYWGQSIAAGIGLSAPAVIIIILFIIVLLELLRLGLGITVFGQRSHEKRQFSSFAWDAIGICLVLLFAPGKQFGIPIIWGCAFGDPFLGELKRLHLSKFIILILGIIFITLIWLLCHWFFGTPLWIAGLMGLITVLAEWPNIPWLDDNITMQFVPLLIVLLLY